jgi:isoquinoline 1-oxidoreductase subunit alpha
LSCAQRSPVARINISAGDITVTTRIQINGKTMNVKAEPDTPLLWVIRDEVGLTGTKFGCGASLCGACTVHLDGQPVRSCQTPLSAAAGKKVTTIEALSANNSHPLQKAWIAHDVPQCGYCQSGQLMSAAALLKGNKNPSDADIDAAMSGNICRCGTYPRIRAAIKTAAAEMRKA